jgi:hypothetical protein
VRFQSVKPEFLSKPPYIFADIRTSEEKRNERRRVKKGTSNIPNEITNTAIENFCDLRQRFERHFFFGSFNVADIISSQIDLFREFFLAETGLLPLGANGFPQDPIDSARG